MTDISITAANVKAGAGAVKESGISGATISAGQVAYLDAATNKYLLCDNDSATVAARSPRGIALNSASDDQPLTIQRAGAITIGATLTAGSAYYLSDTAGGICPVDDLTTPQTVALIGVATSTSVLQLGIISSGVAL